MDEKNWQDCADFHGHECAGLTIGYKAALYAIELLNLQKAEDEEVVCVSENDACGVDAIQVILSCTVGKGNLLFHLTGKQAFSFMREKVVKCAPGAATTENWFSREASFKLHQSKSPAELFDVKETVIELQKREDF